jgi:peptide/nickel transport system permease protein
MRRPGTLAVGAGLVCVGMLVALAVAAGLGVVGDDPQATDLSARLAGPTRAHPLGLDALGRDVMARLLGGARISLLVGGASVAISLVLGVAVGALAGWRGGWLDEVVARVIDVLLAFPGLLLAIGLAAVLGPSLPNVVLALSVLGWTGYARVTRAQIVLLRAREFTQAASALGAGGGRIVVRHLLPLTLPVLLVHATFGLSGAIVAEASLSFLGVGAPPPLPSWGSMLDEGRHFMLVAPHVVIAPACAVAGTVLALQLLGDGLRDLLDVRGAPRRVQP